MKATDGSDKILVCIEGEATKEVIGDLLLASHYDVVNVSSGNDVLTMAKEHKPHLALLDVGMTDIHATEISTQIKENPSLSDTVVILVGSMLEKNTKFRRQPPSLFGADDYLDRYHIQKELLDKVNAHLRIDKTEIDKGANGHSHEAPPVPPTEEQALEGQGLPEENLEDPLEDEKAKRLARIIVSDIALYNEKKVQEGLISGRFHEILRQEIEEGRQLFLSRVSDKLREQTNYYEEEINRFVQAKKTEPQKKIGDPGDDTAVLPMTEGKTEGHQPTSTEEEPETIIPSEIEKAQRLARIIVSDIVIYNEKKVEEGLKNGTFYKILHEEIEEGERLYKLRIPQELLQEKNYYREAIDRFIQKKKAL
ncbi:MAG: two-component system response regulator [Nitrospiria bacterium]